MALACPYRLLWTLMNHASGRKKYSLMYHLNLVPPGEGALTPEQVINQAPAVK